MFNAITYIEEIPVVAIDGEGVSLVIRSGGFAWRRRVSRALWRKFLETSIRQLNEFEIAERADRGRVIPMERKRG